MSIAKIRGRIEEGNYVVGLYNHYIDTSKEVFRDGKKFKDSNGRVVSSARVVHGFAKYMHDVVWPEMQAEERKKKEARKRARNLGAKRMVVA